MLKQLGSIMISRALVAGAIIGGALGVTAGYLDKIGFLTGTVLGIIIGAGIGGLIGLRISGYSEISEQILNVTDHEVKIPLREEQLDISKKQIQTGKVSIHKELVQEEKNITVPITHEELVIEKEIIDAKAPNEIDAHIETIRIPINEERIEVIKHPAALNDVLVYEHQFQETKSVEETIKKEKINLETTGDLEIVEKTEKRC